MAVLKFSGIAITGIAASVPKNIVHNRDVTSLMSEQALNKNIKATGIVSRRVANSDDCSSDFCYHAAARLIDDMNIDKTSLDMVIFVSQTPDYRLPSTAITLQYRLGLPKSTAAFDVNLGCSGYVYGLATAYAFVSQSGIQRILILVGDTPTKFVSPKDRSSALLFGDGGSATIVEKREGSGDAFFFMHSDGSGADILKINAGGYRKKSSIHTLTEKTDRDGNIRNDEQLYMNGAEIFNFTLREVPKDVQDILEFSRNKLDDIDFIIYHQANKFITDFLNDKLNYPPERVPYSLNKFGNTSCASIPLTIVSELRHHLMMGDKKVIFSGFGVGLSWATALLEISGCHISDLVEV
jgi:3-oxoacyl-[acyl-carrier-protein] synthase III